MATIKLRPIERLERPTAAEFSHCAARQKPVVITGAMDDWRALSAWTPEYLEAKVGDARVPVMALTEDQPDGRFFYSGSEGAALTVRQCLALLRSGRPRVYMAGVALADYLPALAGDVELPDFLGSGKRRTRAHIWISGSGSTGPLHYDLGDNIHALVAGRKRFLLFDYQQQKALYPNPAFSSYPTYSRIDLDHPDFDRYPRLREAQGYEVVLEPGEMVFIPTGCWHRVSTPELSIAVNFWLSQHYFRYSTLRLLFPIALRLPIVLALAPLRALLDHQRLNPRRPSRNATRPGGLNP